MSTDLFEASVLVDRYGYEWVVGQLSSGSRPQSYLVPHQMFEPMRLYNPLTEATGLFRNFAELDVSKEAILAFANEYGHLRLEHKVMVPDGSPGHEYLPGDSMDDWCGSVGCMKLAVSLWDMVRSDDLEGLSRHFIWSSEKQLVFRSDPDLPAGQEASWFPWRELGEELSLGCRPGDVVRPARRAIAYCVYHNLGRNVSIELRSLDAEMEIYVSIDGLHDTLWFQFAQAVMGNRDYRQCRTCGKWYELHPDIARTNRFTCSDACRSKAYRQRKADARRLFAEGIAVDEIARRLDTEESTAQSWIDSGRRRSTVE